MKYYVTIGKEEFQLDLTEKDGQLKGRFNGNTHIIDHAEVQKDAKYSVIIDGESFNVSLNSSGSTTDLIVGGHLYHTEVLDERERGAREIESAKAMKGPHMLRSVMPGIVIKVFVEEGQEVAEGDPLLILEAMKMENELSAEKAGVVTKLHVAQGVTVNSNDVLLTIE